MIIFPAIDIINQKVVRLYQGKFDNVTEYSTDPLQTAQKWVDQGAQWLHVVDLDGAKEGIRQNSDIIIKIAQSIDIPVQAGGGIRTEEDIQYLLDGGIARVILGTRATENKDFLKTILSKWGNKIAISLDCKKGMVAQRGWVETSNIKATNLAKELETLGLKCLIYTDIAKDGTLAGPNIAELKSLCAAVNIPIIASGGVSSIEDIKELLQYENQGITGAITGKALYEGKLDLSEAIAVC